MPELRASTKGLSAQDVERAIYIDYEGNVDQLPTLLGWRVDGVNHGAILDPEFATCSDRFRVKCVFLEDHKELVRRLILQAESEDRRLVSWSGHDWRHMMAALSTPDWQTRLCVVYRNAIKTARPWHRKTYGHTPPEASLHHFLTCIGTPQPARYGQAIVGAALRLIRGQLQQGREYAQLTPKARASWVNVVKHNRLDLEGMQFVLKAVTAPWFGAEGQV
jgi:hypothetical protein